jgi:hypothetical protein
MMGIGMGEESRIAGIDILLFFLYNTFSTFFVGFLV